MLVIIFICISILIITISIIWFYNNHINFSDLTARKIEIFGYSLLITLLTWEFAIKNIVLAEFYDIEWDYLSEKLKIIYIGIESIINNGSFNTSIGSDIIFNSHVDDYLKNQLLTVDIIEALLQISSAVCIAIGRFQELKNKKVSNNNEGKNHMFKSTKKVNTSQDVNSKNITPNISATNKTHILLMIFILIVVLLIAAFNGQGLYLFIMINSIVLIILLLSLLKWMGFFSYIKYTIQQYVPMIIVPVLALLFFCILLNNYEPQTQLNKAELISFYGDYLSFIGAFCLGFFIYRRNEASKIDEKIAKCKLLLNCIETTDADMLRVARHGYKPSYIHYDSNWISYFHDYESLTHSSDFQLQQKLTKHFRTVDRMNLALANKNYTLASEIFEGSVISDCYSIAKYNTLEAKFIISDACKYKKLGHKSYSGCWLENPKNKKIFLEYSKKYYPVVEMYVWNHMIKNNIIQTSNQRLDREITDWLLTNDVFKKLAPFPSDKRIVSKIVFDCFILIEHNSTRLSYCWGEFSLK